MKWVDKDGHPGDQCPVKGSRRMGNILFVRGGKIGDGEMGGRRQKRTWREKSLCLPWLYVLASEIVKKKIIVCTPSAYGASMRCVSYERSRLYLRCISYPACGLTKAKHLRGPPSPPMVPCLFNTVGVYDGCTQSSTFKASSTPYCYYCALVLNYLPSHYWQQRLSVKVVKG